MEKELKTFHKVWDTENAAKDRENMRLRYELNDVKRKAEELQASLDEANFQASKRARVAAEPPTDGIE